MAHQTLKSGYARLADRLNRFPQGAPPSQLLYKILAMLFSEKEAHLAALLPLRPFTPEQAGRAWGMGPVAARNILDELAGRGILVDMEFEGERYYVLPPPMAGFFEFSMMRVRADLDQRLLSELFHQYINVEEDFIRALFFRGETQLGRVFVHEPALANENALFVLDYERASEVIKRASHIGIGICYCRHKMSHLGNACDAPLEICMTFNVAAASLIRHGSARRADAAEGIALLQKARELNLVQFGENVREGVNFICNCCGCCCDAMTAVRRFGTVRPMHTTNFIPKTDEAVCTGCGRCARVCPVDAVALVPASAHGRPGGVKAGINEGVCLGCGLCAKECPAGGIRLQPRPVRVITPLDSFHRTVVMAIERGTLQNFIFHNRALWSHRALAAVLGVILRLPPVRQVLACRQVKSRYLEFLLGRMGFTADRWAAAGDRP